MTSVLNWIYYHEFFWIFPNCLSIFLGQNMEFGFILFWKFLSCGARRSATLSPSSRSYWTSRAALPDTVGAVIKPPSRPAVRRRPSPCLTRRPRPPRSDASPTLPPYPSATPLSEHATVTVRTRRRCPKPLSPPVRSPSRLSPRRRAAVSTAAFLPTAAPFTDLFSCTGRPNRARRASIVKLI
jgi:hypothetical protein